MISQLDKIKKIILGNPYKYKNYTAFNSSLAPPHLNQEDDETPKQPIKPIENTVIQQYQLYKKMNNGKTHMPKDFKDKLQFL